MARKVEIDSAKMDDIKKAAFDFRDSVARVLKDHHVEVKDWKVGTESHEEGITIDVSVKVLIKPKAKK
jgi:hypothetical protein